MQESQGITQDFLTAVPKATLEGKKNPNQNTVATELAITEVENRGSPW